MDANKAKEHLRALVHDLSKAYEAEDFEQVGTIVSYLISLLTEPIDSEYTYLNVNINSNVDKGTLTFTVLPKETSSAAPSILQ